MRNTTFGNIFTLQFWGIFLVVLGHSLPYKDMPICFQLLFQWIYAFHMPLFFSISGYLYKCNLSKYISAGRSKFVHQKFVRLIIPFIFLNILTFPIKIILESFTYRSVGHDLIDFVGTFLYLDQIPIGNLWFVVVLFQLFIIFFFLLPKRIIERPLLLVPIFILLNYVFSVLPIKYGIYNVLGCGTAISNLLYFYIGMLIFDSKDKQKSNGCIRVILSLIGYLLIVIYVSHFSDCFYFTPFIAVVGIISSWGLASDINISQTRLAIIAKYSYQIYLLSWFPQVFIRIVFSDKAIISLPYSVIVFTSCLLGIIIPILIAKLIQKSKFRILIGM